jgi:CrcB protein
MNSPLTAFSIAGWSGIVAIGLGAMLGAWLRFALGAMFNQAFGALPVGTLIANLAGAFLIGLAIAWLGRHPEIPPVWRLFTITGFLGALTTFSTFSAESLELLQRGDYRWALVHAGGHLFGSLAMAGLGFSLARQG